MLLNKVTRRIRRELGILIDKSTIHRRFPQLTYVYDALLQRVPLEEIERRLPGPVSEEVRRIMRVVGTADRTPLPPLPASPTLAVIIPHYNHQAFLAETLRCLAEQTRKPDEVIVVDDISQDQAALRELVASFADELAVTLLVNESKQYAGGSRERGARASRADILVMHDADDLSHPRRLEVTEQFFEAHPTAPHLNVGHAPFSGAAPAWAAVGEDWRSHTIPPQALIDRMRERFKREEFGIIREGFPYRAGSYGVEGTHGCQAGHVAYRREIVGRLAWSNPTNQVFTQFEDFEFNLLLLLMFGDSYQVDLPLIGYRLGSTTNMAGHGLAQT